MRHDQLRPYRHPSQISELWDQAVLGLKTDMIPVSINAFTPDLSQNITEISTNITVTDLPLTAVEHFVVSDNAADTHEVLITLLDEDMVREQRFVTLDGTTPVSLGTIYRALFIENASGLLDLQLQQVPMNLTDGIITVYQTGGTGVKGDTKTFLVLEKDYGDEALLLSERSLGSASTIPAGCSGYAFGFNAISGKADEVKLAIQARIFGGVWETIIPDQFFESTQVRIIRPRFVPQLTDLRILGMRVGGNPVPMSFSYQLLLIKNTVEV